MVVMADLEELLRLGREFSSKPPDLDEIARWQNSRLWMWIKCSLRLSRLDLLEGIAQLAENDSNPARGQVAQIDQVLSMLDMLELSIKTAMEAKEKEDG